MINQTLYNLRRNYEAKIQAREIVNFLEGREKNRRFIIFLNQKENKSLLIEAKNQKKDPNEALQEMVDKYHKSLDKIEQQSEKFAELNGQLVIAKQKQEEEKEEIIKNKKKKKKKRRKKKKKTIQKYKEEINKNYKEQDWAEIAMLEEEI